MLELGRKEQHLMGGWGLFILVVVLMVFAYTQAIRQVKLGRELSARLQEQLAVAREQLARPGPRPELPALKARLGEFKASLAAPDSLADQSRRFEKLAGRLGIRDVRMEVAESPSKKISVPLEEEADFQVHLVGLEMAGRASTRRIAALVAVVADPAFKPVYPLVAMELGAGAGTDDDEPVEFTLRWMVAVSPDSTAPVQSGLPAPREPPPWGWREEPFLSPFSHSDALRLPAEKTSPFRLSGILQQSGTATCVINGIVLKPGDFIREYRVVLILPGVVLLEGKGEEILLRLP